MPRLIRGLLILSLLVLIGIVAHHLNTTDVSSRISQAAGFAPTPTPILKKIARMQTMLIDEHGKINGVWSGEDLPLIIGETGPLYQGGMVSGAGIGAVLQLITTLAELDVAVNEASIYNDTYTQLLLTDGVVVLYSSKRDPLKTAYELQELYAILDIEGTLPKKIDLRFEKPALIHEL